MSLPQRRLGLALAGYGAGVIVLVTLVPFRFAWPDRLILFGFSGIGDLVANIGFFLPLGFFLAFAGADRPLALGFLLSALVEVAQEFIPGRFPSPLDLATNTLGTGLGALAYRAARTALARRADEVGVLALDLPLAGLLYLLVPLLWLSGLASGADPDRRALVALVGLAGSVVLAAIDRHLLRARGTPRWVVPVAGALWFALGLLPGWYRDPPFLAAGALGVGLAVWLLGAELETNEEHGRRYETPAVRRAGLPFLTFAALAAVWPIGDLTPAWHWSVGVSWARDAAQLPILRFLELASATAVAGYGLAETRGRRAESERRSRRAAWLAALGLALGLEALRGFQPDYGASLVEGGLLAAAARLGASVYWRQRAFVRAVLGRDSSPARSRVAGYWRIGPAGPVGEGAP